MSANTFQDRAAEWYRACFPDFTGIGGVERAHRFLEEALELAQANLCSKEDAHALVDYVFGRPPGGPESEVGGVMVTLAILCEISGLDMRGSGEQELARNWRRIDAIRAKRSAKPAGSALPQ